MRPSFRDGKGFAKPGFLQDGRCVAVNRQRHALDEVVVDVQLEAGAAAWVVHCVLAVALTTVLQFLDLKSAYREGVELHITDKRVKLAIMHLDRGAGQNSQIREPNIGHDAAEVIQV